MGETELKEYVQTKAKEYWNESSDVKVETFPMSVVDFVVEFAFNSSNFPSNYTSEKCYDILARYKTTLAMMCVDVYGKAGADGETSHSENGISRHYESAWISKSLIASLPNFVTVL